MFLLYHCGMEVFRNFCNTNKSNLPETKVLHFPCFSLQRSSAATHAGEKRTVQFYMVPLCLAESAEFKPHFEI